MTLVAYPIKPSLNVSRKNSRSPISLVSIPVKSEFNFDVMVSDAVDEMPR